MKFNEMKRIADLNLVDGTSDDGILDGNFRYFDVLCDVVVVLWRTATDNNGKVNEKEKK